MDAVIISKLNVFDGKNFVGTKDVAIDGKLIADNVLYNAEIIDGTGKTLLPGL